MTHTVTLKELRPQLPQIANAIERKLDRYIVTRRGRPVMTILSPEDYEGLLETIEILSDKTAVRRIKKSLKQARAGKTIPWEDVKRRLERL
jgi:antitoxin YefM